MTILSKPVTREAVQKIQGDSAIVTLYPAGFVEIRRKGKREAYRMSFECIFIEAARRQAESLRRERGLNRWKSVRLAR
jgi:hypothetical protein